MRARRGLTLGVVLMVVAMAVMAAFVLAGTTVFHLGFSTHATAQQAARNLAQSALSDAVAQLMSNPTFGQGKETRRPAQDERAHSVVTFDPDVAAHDDVLCSYNNVPTSPDAIAPPALVWPPPPQPEGVETYGVPQHAVLVSSRADVDGVTARAVAIVHFPVFAYALASSGAIHSQGPLLVTAAATPEAPADALRNASGAGSIASNSVDNRALVLNAGAKVTGNAISQGGIVVDPDALVQGAVEPYARQVGLPTVDVAALDPVAQGMPGIQPVPATVTRPQMTGFNRSDGPLQVDGDLTLSDGVLFVKGDLQVGGGISGHGVVIVTGKTTVQGGGSMTATGTAALVSAGDVSIRGVDAQQSAFSGLIYTQGNLSARNITLMGAFIGCGERSQVDLDTVNVVHQPAMTRIELNTSTTQTTFSYPEPNAPAYIGPNLVKIAWIRYTKNGTAVYALSDLPDQPPVPLPQFWDVLANHLKAKGLPDSMFGPGWQDVKTLRSNNDGNWYPVSHFLQYLHDLGAPPEGAQSGGGVPTTTTTNGHYVFDINRFISPADRLRVLMWRVQ